MALRTLDHCSIRTLDLPASRDFYVDVLGMDEGYRPDLPFPGVWLYLEDHIAFCATDASAMIERLKRNHVPYRERQVPNMDLSQIFVEDPNGITIELNYFESEQ